MPSVSVQYFFVNLGKGVTTSVIDTGGKFAAGVNDVGGKFANGVNQWCTLSSRI
jgi:hypothetical protein